MKRLLTALILLGWLCLPASAGPVEDSIVRQLRDQGFGQIEVRRTMLGRSRITAKSRDLKREIVVNPVTGVILRDYWSQPGGLAAPQIVDPQKSYSEDDEYEDSDDDDDDSGRGRGRGRGRGGDDDDDDDDNDSSGSGSGDDDADDSDNSGSGSGGDDGDSDGDDV